jgi:peroxiredoxin (alkyl hydroperoxide reductase subunit C)
MSNQKDGCVKPARGPIGNDDAPATATAAAATQEVTRVQAKVGHPAPDFEATAYVEGKGFEPVTLSDHKGKWIVLCFYPGDFTFV